MSGKVLWKRVKLLILQAVTGAFCLGPLAALAAPKAVLWERWLANDPESPLRVDYSAWAAFLRKYLEKREDGVNLLAYGGVRPEDEKALAGYLARLGATPVRRLRRPEQLAYWINLYNALTVKVVLDHYPVESILELNISPGVFSIPGLFSIGPWGKKLITVEGVALSLDDIEHRILRPIWRDPRIHYAVNCASVGCPNLAPIPYTAETADRMLTEGARAYVNHPRGVRLEGGRLTVSSIYHWYRADFGGTDAGVIAHLRQYASPSLAARLEGVARIHAHGYDWSLNEAKAWPAPGRARRPGEAGP